VPPALAAPSSAVVAPARADDELTLAALMDLFEPEELEDTTTSTLRSSRRASTHGLRTWTHERFRWSAELNLRLGGSRRAW
jgi:hypothetical protein